MFRAQSSNAVREVNAKTDFALDPSPARSCCSPAIPVRPRPRTGPNGPEQRSVQKGTSHGSSQCQHGTYQTAFVLVNLTPSQGKAAYDLMHSNPNLGHAVVVADVAGLGDRAFELSGPNTASVYFDKGDVLVLVMVEIRTATSPPQGQALALAKTAANRV